MKTLAAKTLSDNDALVKRRVAYREVLAWRGKLQWSDDNFESQQISSSHFFETDINLLSSALHP